MRKLLILSLFLLPLIADASDIPSPRWKLVSIDSNQNSFFYVDSNTKTKTSAWMLQMNSNPEKTHGSIRDSRLVKSTKDKIIYQCETKKFGIQESIIYYQDGKSKHSKVTHAILDEAVPDSIGESLIEYLCKK